MGNQRFSITQARAVKDKRVSNAQHRTLAALGLYGDADGWCFPNQSTLAEDLGKSRQAVSADLNALAKLGYVEIHHQFRENGSQKGNRYRLIFDTPPQAQLAPPASSEVAPLTTQYNDCEKDRAFSPESTSEEKFTAEQIAFFEGIRDGATNELYKQLLFMYSTEEPFCLAYDGKGYNPPKKPSESQQKILWDVVIELRVDTYHVVKDGVEWYRRQWLHSCKRKKISRPPGMKMLYDYFKKRIESSRAEKIKKTHQKLNLAQKTEKDYTEKEPAYNRTEPVHHDCQGENDPAYCRDHPIHHG